MLKRCNVTSMDELIEEVTYLLKNKQMNLKVHDCFKMNIKHKKLKKYWI